jgi:hypothetical protein
MAMRVMAFPKGPVMNAAIESSKPWPGTLDGKRKYSE